MILVAVFGTLGHRARFADVLHGMAVIQARSATEGVVLYVLHVLRALSTYTCCRLARRVGRASGSRQSVLVVSEWASLAYKVCCPLRRVFVRVGSSVLRCDHSPEQAVF